MNVFSVRLFLVAFTMAVLCGVSNISFCQNTDERPSEMSEHSPLPILPLTTAGADGTGYMADPQPIHLAAGSTIREQFISGTTKAVLRCPLPVHSGCFTSQPLQVVAGELRTQIAAAGAEITNIQNVDLFQNDAGQWHAAVTVGIKTARHPEHWTVLVHAHPVAPVSPGSAPLIWSMDTLLTGSFTEAVNGNYDGKYYVESGHLYLLYVRGTAPPPALRNAIVLQPMISEKEATQTEPVTLLTPGDRNGELNSEWYANTEAKLVEAPYLSVVEGKHLLVYSTGAYLTNGYKTGVAWSDDLMPVGKGRYRTVLVPDPSNIWGNSGKPEIRYLLQSQKPHWPNYVARQVIGPGVLQRWRRMTVGGGSFSMVLHLTTCRRMVKGL